MNEQRNLQTKIIDRSNVFFFLPSNKFCSSMQILHVLRDRLEENNVRLMFALCLVSVYTNR